MSVNNNYPFLQSNSQLTENFLKKIVLVVNNLMNGKSNNTGELTLSAGATSTVVSNNLVNENSVIVPVAQTTNAAIATGIRIVAGDKQFTIYHNNTAATDRTFKYAVIG